MELEHIWFRASQNRCNSSEGIPFVESPEHSAARAGAAKPARKEIRESFIADELVGVAGFRYYTGEEPDSNQVLTQSGSFVSYTLTRICETPLPRLNMKGQYVH